MSDYRPCYADVMCVLVLVNHLYVFVVVISNADYIFVLHL